MEAEMAFCAAHGRLVRTEKRARCRRRKPVKAEVPVGFTIVAAGVCTTLRSVHSERAFVPRSRD